MGLDMYLEAKRGFYNSKWDKEHPTDGTKTNEKLRKMFPEMFMSDNLNYVYIGFEVGYWRKANQIHNWFVSNCQDGEDDCTTHCVYREQLEELKELCEKVIKTAKLVNGQIRNGYHINENGTRVYDMEDGKIVTNQDEIMALLPPQEGFFFGSTDIDEWYINDIKNTIEIIDKCLALPKEWDFYYHSSW